jgi:hypothetical protein
VVLILGCSQCNSGGQFIISANFTPSGERKVYFVHLKSNTSKLRLALNISHMKAKCLGLFFCQLLFTCAIGQQDPQSAMTRSIGVKAGVNLNHVSAAGYFHPSSQTGFMAGAYFSFPSRGLGYRTELIYSRQGYHYESNTSTGSVKLDYVLLPQLMTINIGRLLQLHAGGQLAFLLNSDVDSTSNVSRPPSGQAVDVYNKINYGLGAGAEIRPLAGLLVGGRYNLFFKTLGEAVSSPSSPLPPYVPPYNSNLKNGVIQLYVGYLF